jgi:hypothetical protein
MLLSGTIKNSHAVGRGFDESRFFCCQRNISDRTFSSITAQVILEQINRHSRVARAEVAGTPQNDNPYNRENAKAHDQRFHPSPSVSCLPIRLERNAERIPPAFVKQAFGLISDLSSKHPRDILRLALR